MDMNGTNSSLTLRLGYVTTVYPLIRSCGLNPESVNCPLPGLSIEMWREVANSLGYSRIKYIQNNEYGFKQDDGSWNGLVGMLINDKIDATLSILNMNRDVSHDGLEYGPVLRLGEYGFIIGKAYQKDEHVHHTQGFTLWPWICIMATVLAVAILSKVVEAGSFHEQIWITLSQFRFHTPWRIKSLFVPFLMVSFLNMFYMSSIQIGSLLQMTSRSSSFQDLNKIKSMIISGKYRLFSHRSFVWVLHALADGHEMTDKQLKTLMKWNTTLKVNESEVAEYLCTKNNHVFFGDVNPTEFYMRELRQNPCPTKVIPLKSHLQSFVVKKNNMSKQIQERFGTLFHEDKRRSLVKKYSFIKYNETKFYSHADGRQIITMKSMRTIFEIYMLLLSISVICFIIEVKFIAYRTLHF